MNLDSTEKPPKKNVNKRRQSRAYAMQILFQWHFSHEPPQVLFQHFLAEHIETDKPADLNYSRTLFFGAVEHMDAIDALMTPCLDRSITSLNPVELSLLRLAIYEIEHHPEVPPPVVINEAIELAKEFGSVEGYKFVNGVLNAIVKRTR